mmetsp:Transcript_3615/g.5483  ORF Transcript_3615/g.5483 Transcript_3615/m.5483 type:complete len:373 (+) Transcript_3615:22-1140(+)
MLSCKVSSPPPSLDRDNYDQPYYHKAPASEKSNDEMGTFRSMVTFDGHQILPTEKTMCWGVFALPSSNNSDRAVVWANEGVITPPLTPISVYEEEKYDEEECFCAFPFTKRLSERRKSLSSGSLEKWSMHKNQTLTDRTVPWEDDVSESEEEDDPLPRVEDFIPVNIDKEPPSVLEEYPPILTEPMMQQLSDRGLPLTAKLMKWSRVYSITRDGDNFQTMIQNCASYYHTVVVIKTTTGDILGGYADSPWKKQHGYQSGTSFYGSGQAFLFATNPVVEADDVRDNQGQDTSSSPYVHIYHWTGENSYCQVCDEEGGRIAMGGGGSFGLLVQDNFIIGSSGRCSTFGNPPLTSEGDGFDVLEMEVYGLKTALF